MSTQTAPEAPEALDEISRKICEVGSLSSIQPDEDIYEAGFSSIRALNLLMELEDVYGVTIEDDQFIAARTPRQLLTLVDGLRREQS